MVCTIGTSCRLHHARAAFFYLLFPSHDSVIGEYSVSETFSQCSWQNSPVINQAWKLEQAFCSWTDVLMADDPDPIG